MITTTLDGRAHIRRERIGVVEGVRGIGHQELGVYRVRLPLYPHDLPNIVEPGEYIVELGRIERHTVLF
jgi:hypothetical protein